MNEFEKDLFENQKEEIKPVAPASEQPKNPYSYNGGVFKAEEKAQPKQSAPSPSQASGYNYGSPATHTVNGAGSVGGQAAYSAPTPGYSWNTGSAQSGTYTNPQYRANPAPQPAKPKKKGSAGKIALVLIAAFIISVVGGAIGSSISKGISGSTGNAVIYQSDTKTSKDTDSTGSAKTSNTVESVAENTAASVVEVKTSTIQRGTFFGDYVTSGAGSGVIISEDGYIVTNNHVIENANEITVTLKSGKDYKATLVGTDEKTDIAVLKIDAKGLTPATFGDSTSVAVGEQIVVIGNPLGSLGGSVTTGIISATGREIEVENMTMTLLQIDAAVNPGNSGGALFNLNGELIGVVNAKYSSEEVEGLGFAIPINTAKKTIEDIIAYGYVKGRAQLGITAVEINDLQTALSAGVNELGVYVYSVNDGSGADKAGLRAGDRIVKIDNKEVDSYSTLSKILDSHSVGDTVKLTYSRNGVQKEVSVKLVEYKPTSNNNNTKSN